MKFLKYTVILVLGFLIGTTAGEIMRLLLPEHFSTMALFTSNWTHGFSNLHYNLRIININLDIEILVNTFSWLGLIVSAMALLIREVRTK